MNRPICIASTLLIALTASMAGIAIGSDFTLNIFGNANMDDRIDQTDIDYIQEIIIGVIIVMAVAIDRFRTSRSIG